MHYGCVERVEETYVRQRAGQSIRVKVVVESLTGRIVKVSPSAFSRIDGQVGDEPTDEYQRATISGAMSALTDADTGGEVTILEVDCVPGQVRAATLSATPSA